MKYFKAIIISSDGARYIVVFDMFEIRNYVKHAK